MAALCAFANSTAADEGPYMPPLLRAITLHFMMGYDHYFADGNGRTSRAVFYWSMLRQGFFLAEFLSISRLLRRAQARYAHSFPRQRAAGAQPARSARARRHSPLHAARPAATGRAVCSFCGIRI